MNLEQLSKSDKRFLEILDAGTRKNGNHYQVPLLSKSQIKDAPVKEKVQKSS